jgi:hypothetical protein
VVADKTHKFLLQGLDNHVYLDVHVLLILKTLCIMVFVLPYPDKRELLDVFYLLLEVLVGFVDLPDLLLKHIIKLYNQVVSNLEHVLPDILSLV